MQINCLYPVTIFHPYSRYYLSKYRHYLTPNGLKRGTVLPYIPYKSLDPESLEQYKIINPDTSETFPVFLQVRCNKCLLCRRRKSSQLSFRATRMTHQYGNPLFLTLTYNDTFKPLQGVSKRHIQLFFKRVRKYLQSHNLPTDIRYLAVSEYGTKTQRPHYHLLIWNYKTPSNNLHTLLHDFESIWTDPVTQQSYGYCYVLPGQKGCINYVTKYMLKSNIPPKGQNPNFILKSKNFGKLNPQQTKMILKNPGIITESTTDIMCNKSITRPFTEYSKSHLYPSESRVLGQIFTKQVRTTCAMVNLLRSLYYSLPYNLRKTVPYHHPKLYTQLCQLLKHTHLINSQYVDQQLIRKKLFSCPPPGSKGRVLYYLSCLDILNSNIALCYLLLDKNRLNCYYKSLQPRLINSAATSLYYSNPINLHSAIHTAQKDLNKVLTREKL